LESPAPDAPLTDRLARRAAERRLAGRQADLARQMDAIVAVTHDLIEDRGTLDPSLRQILAAAHLSTQAFYRCFASKDELLLAVLDDGRRRLVDHLQARMARATTPAGTLKAYIEGVLAQAADPVAARRTRPWVAHEDRLAERYPDEHRASVDQLVDLAAGPVAALAPGRSAARVRADAEFVYRLSVATLQAHLVAGTTPDRAATARLVAFCTRGVGG
jgi:AcrR family transcriptional regulator